MRRIARPVLALLAVGWSVWCLLAAVTPAATAAAPPTCTACQGGIRYGPSGYAGAYVVGTPAGRVGDTYCVQSHRWYPDSPHAAGVPVARPDAATWAAFLAPATPPRGDADQAAVSERVARDLEGVDEQWRAVDQHARSDALWAAAQAVAGPYTLHLDVVTAPAGTAPGTVHVAVTAASGRVVPARVELTGTGVVLPGPVDSPADVTLTVPAAGAWSVTGTASGLPPSTVLRYAALDPREQSVVGAGPPSSAAATVTGQASSPTRVSLVKLDAASGRPLAGAVIEVRDVRGSAVATVTTAVEPVTVPLPPGSYTAREVRAPAGHLLDDPAPKAFTVTGRGDAVTLTWNDHGAHPVIATQASAARVEPGASVTDRITVTGLPDGAGPVELVSRLLGPVPGPCERLTAADFGQAAVVSSARVTVRPAGQGRGDVVSPPVTVPDRAGCYTFTQSGTGPMWPGGPTLVSPPAVPAESVEVVAPALHTVVTAARGTPGTPVADVVTVTGLPAWAGPRTLAVSLTGPVRPAPDGTCDTLPEDSWAGAAVVATTQVVVPADGEVTTPTVTLPDAPGCYSFAERDTAALWPGGPTVTAPVGRPGESVLVHAPAVAQGRTPTQLARTGVDLPVGPLAAAGVALLADGAWLLSWAARPAPRPGLSRSGARTPRRRRWRR